LRRGYADLHLHTHYSDGLCSPAEVVEAAARAGLSWVAITDHDTVGGLDEGSAAAQRLGIGFVPAVELSIEFRGQDFHILAYWIDPADHDLSILLEQVSRSRIARARRILSRLHGLGVRLSMEAVKKQAPLTHALGRAHIARALVEAGEAGSFADVFARYLGLGGPAYVPKETVGPGEALRVLRAAGGVPVLAHPGIYQMDGAWETLLNEGIGGIETEHPMHTAKQAAGLRRLAARYNLVATGGSDFHGGGVPQSQVGGIRVEACVLDRLFARK
jgi:predicted metal-dependent phosphoesterase TrpH